MIPIFSFFQGYYENSKEQTRGKPTRVNRDVQKSVEEDGKRNEHKKELSQLQCASQVCNHVFILLCTSN